MNFWGAGSKEVAALAAGDDELSRFISQSEQLRRVYSWNLYTARNVARAIFLYSIP
jgi:hypothetical protein